MIKILCDRLLSNPKINNVTDFDLREDFTLKDIIEEIRYNADLLVRIGHTARAYRVHHLKENISPTQDEED